MTIHHMTRGKEVAPEVENQGVSDFDVDAFLATILRPLVKQEPQCPRCLVDTTFGSIQHEMVLNGSITAAP